MSKLKIDKDVPIPARRNGAIPFANMQSGDSVFVPGEVMKNPASSAKQWAAKHGGEFIVRRVEGGYRVWRV